MYTFQKPLIITFEWRREVSLYLDRYIASKSAARHPTNFYSFLSPVMTSREYGNPKIFHNFRTVLPASVLQLLQISTSAFVLSFPLQVRHLLRTSLHTNFQHDRLEKTPQRLINISRTLMYKVYPA